MTNIKADREGIRKILADYLRTDCTRLKDDVRFREDLGLDSLAFVVLLHDLGGRFKVDIPDYQSQRIRSVGDALSLLEKHQP